VTWGICYEFLRVVTHPRVMRHPWTMEAGVGFLTALQASPGLGVLVPTDRHLAVLAEVVAEVPGLSGNIVHDTQTAVLMREHGIRRVCTRDTDFHRFPFLEPVDPLTAEP
jgi:predicted nucleic acid-binding protein